MEEYMQINNIIQSYRQVGYRIFSSIDKITILHKIVLCLCFAILTGIMAQIRIYLPFTPVPITGQVFSVLLSAIILGGYYGSLSQAIYLSLGAFGIPWFNGGIGGLAVITGLTGGYLIGFIPAVFIVGLLTRKFLYMRSLHFQLLLMMSGVFVIYVFGAMQVAFILKIGISEAIRLAVLPFIAIDLIKAIFVAGISSSIIPR
jgi:biotin transport system substrate-specific component